MSSLITNIKNNIAPSIVVFLVALPLCMGIALASGMSPLTGLLSGIIGGLIIGPLAGAPLQVSGPAAGLVVIVHGIIIQDGIAGLAMATLIAGILQVLAGVFKQGETFKLIPNSVITGMLMGIGTLIFFSQIHVLFDYSSGSSFSANLLGVGETAMGVLREPSRLIVAALSLGIILFWTPISRKLKLEKLPSQLLAVILVSLLVPLLSVPVKMVEISNDVFSHLGDGVLWKNFEGLTLSMVMDGIILGVVASAESMLSTGAIKNLKPDTPAHYSKELFAQGVGNMAAGLLGAIPVTGVIVRSSANIESGATSRASAIMHGLWLLLFISFGAFLLNHIPLAVLAAILCVIGWKLIKPKNIYLSLKNFNYDSLLMLSTWLGVIFIDLLSGVCIGIGLAIARSEKVRSLFKQPHS